MGTVVGLNPVSRGPGVVGGREAGLSDLPGKTVGFLSNNKPNADVLLVRVADRLAEKHNISARHYRKAVPSIQAPGELIDEVAKDCHAVVLAIND